MERLAVLAALAGLLSSGTPARPRIVGISHVAVRVSNVAARAFYEEFLGLRGLAVNAHQHVELLPGLAADQDRLDHLAFETEDAGAMRRYQASRSVEVPAESPGNHRVSCRGCGRGLMRPTDSRS